MKVQMFLKTNTNPSQTDTHTLYTNITLGASDGIVYMENDVNTHTHIYT